ELKDAIGLFAKYIPLRSFFEEGLRFNQLWSQVEQTVNEFSQWQEYFSLSSAAVSERGLIDSSVFDYAFIFEEEPGSFSAGGVTFSIGRCDVALGQFKVRLSCAWKAHTAVALTFHYDPKYFDAETIKCLVEQFHTLASSAVNDPDAKIDDLEIVSESERDQLLFDFNR